MVASTRGLLALAMATAPPQKPPAPKPAPSQNRDRARKAIAKKVRTGKVQRMIKRAVDPEAGARQDAERKERKRMEREAGGAMVVSRRHESPGGQRKVKATACVSPGGRHWDLKIE
jgi:hypothetical protein